jgi:two-component system OmpR family sensor kinase
VADAPRRRGPLAGISIRWKLTIAYVALVTAVVAILGFALYRGLESFLLDDVGARTTTSVQRIATRELTRLPLSRDPEATPRPIRNPRRTDVRRVARNLVAEISGRDTSVMVMWPDGSTIAGSSPVPDVPPWPVATTEEIEAAAASGEPIRRIDATRSPRALLTVEAIRSAAGDLLAVSSVATTLEGGDSALGQLRTALVFGLLAAILLGILLGLPLTRILLRPLDRIVDAAQRISAGDRDVRVGDPGDRTEIGRLGVAFDTMVDRLEASADIQRRFVADASHELRTPLAALSGMTEMLLLGIDQGDRAAVDRILTAMHREIARLGRLASDLLLLSQLEDGSGGRLPLTTAPIDVAALIDEVIEAMAPLTSGRAVRSEVDAGLVVVGDPDRLKQVLVNLVENAARHTFPGGTIVIAGHHVSDGGVALSVADDGDGLAPGDADRIFDRFYRSDSARARSAAGAGSDTGTEAGPLATNGSDDTATSEGGAGLGLAIVRAIAEAHGGWAAAASPGPGLGTTVTVTLPATPGRAGAGRGPDAPSSATRQGSPDQTAD